ncbi:MAG: hypothetical protein ACKV2T_07600 [Kofleriaceae bacterium]
MPFISLFAIACGSVNENKGDAGVDGSGDATVDALEIDAPPVACTETTCTSDVLSVCGTDNMIERTEQCHLGCFDQTRCNLITPSSGLASAVDQAATQADITLPDGTTINTDTGVVTGLQGTIAVATSTVTQAGAPSIRILVAKTFTLGSLRVSGSLPLAIVADTKITVQGVVDISADGATAGPGGSICSPGAGGAPGSGFFERLSANNSGGYPQYLWTMNGGGGGGFGTSGGMGGTSDANFADGAAGPANGTDTLVPLRGGCAGYAESNANRGAGAGAIQLVANGEVHFVNGGGNRGAIDAGGGGGAAGALGRAETTDTNPVFGPAGGGSGGAILIEAGKVTLDDATGLFAGGGGGGGYGSCAVAPRGADATPGGIASGGVCGGATRPAGNGGAGATTGAGEVGGDSNAGSGGGGGGGGGLGRIRFNTRDAMVTTGAGTILRGERTAGTASVR